MLFQKYRKLKKEHNKLKEECSYLLTGLTRIRCAVSEEIEIRTKMGYTSLGKVGCLKRIDKLLMGHWIHNEK